MKIARRRGAPAGRVDDVQDSVSSATKRSSIGHCRTKRMKGRVSQSIVTNKSTRKDKPVDKGERIEMDENVIIWINSLEILQRLNVR